MIPGVSKPGVSILRADILSRSIFLLCLLAPWSLLWLDSGLLFPFETGKAWLFRSIVSIALAISFVYKFAFTTDPPPDAQFHKTMSPKTMAPKSVRIWQYAMLVFLLWTALANIFGIDVYRSFWSNYERMSGYLAYLYWAAYFLCLITVLSLHRSRILLLNLLIVILLVGFIGLLELEPGKRAISTLGNPIYLGNLAVFAIFISGFLVAGTTFSARWRPILLGILFSLAVMILILVLFKTASRGPMIALLVGMMVMLFRLVFTFSSKTRRGILIAMSAATIIIVMLGAGINQQLTGLLKNSDSYALQRLGKISLHNQTTADRLENWKIALNTSYEYPVMGWGQENYAIAYHEHYRAGVMDKAKIWFDRAHNAYLDVLVASGWPGLLLYVLMLLVPMILVIRHSGWKPLEQACMLGLFSAYMVKNLVGFDTFSSTLIWVSVAAMLWHSTRKKLPLAVPIKKYLPTSVLLMLVMVPTVLLIYVLSVKPYMENRMYARLVNQSQPLQSRSMQRLLSLPATSLTYAPNAKLAVIDLVIRNLRDQALNKQQMLTRKQLYSLARTLVNQELQRQPRNARISYNGAILLAYLGEYALSLELLESILSSSPQRTVIWHQLGRAYEAAGQPEAARKAYAQQNSLNAKWGTKPNNVL